MSVCPYREGEALEDPFPESWVQAAERTIVVEHIGRQTILTIIIATIAAVLFKALYPEIPLSEGLAVIIVISLVIAAALNLFWSRKSREKGDK